MRKSLKSVVICGLLSLSLWSCFLISDRRKLNSGLIRFHVVANSNSEADQAIKLKVRDVVLDSMRSDLETIADVEQAREYLQQNLPKLQNLVNRTLEDLGVPGDSRISLCKERFDIRHYDTFSLPAGVYDSLRIVIGDGLGENWWCVSFPGLCIPATTSGFAEAAVEAGFSEPLTRSLSHNEGYEIRFFFLNQLGKLETLFFQE